MSISCGNCKSCYETVDQIRACCTRPPRRHAANRQRRIGISGVVVPRLAAAVLLVVGLLASESTGRARAEVAPTDSPSSANHVSAAGITSGNLEWIKTVPFGAMSPSGRKVGRYFYATDWVRGLVIFDVSTPEHPTEVGALPLVDPKAHVAENEDLATNGRIALISRLGDEHYISGDHHVHPLSVLYIVDVSDKTAPRVIAEVPGAGDHTYECLFDCTWAYGAVGGHIVDLREPTKPRLSTENWHDGLGLASVNPAHDVFEVRPGLALTGSLPATLLLDVKDPENPVKLAESKGHSAAFHQVNWPNQGDDRFVLGGNEGIAPSASARCEVTREENEALNLEIGFQTWNASDWRKHGFTFADHYLPENGNYLDGDPAVSVGGLYGNGGCTAHYFDPHPSFRDGGLVAHSTWGNGMKLLEVASSDGKITEAGFFLPHAGNIVSAYWITPRIVYTIDAQRGIDVLRYVGKLPT